MRGPRQQGSPLEPLILYGYNRIRHKKCDEIRPACSQCSSTGRRCDFLLPEAQAPLTRPTPGLFFQPSPAGVRPLSSQESVQFEFFRLICAPEYAVLFEAESWEPFVLRSAIAEPCIYHAALAISALTWRDYAPTTHWYEPVTGARSATEYSTIQYNRAIRLLNARLDSGSGMDRNVTKLTILSALLFINIEFLRWEKTSAFREEFIVTHVNGATRLLRDLTSRFGRQPDPERDCLETAVLYMQYQAEQFKGNTL